ncbi:MAG TPA: DUF6288 domain-containing protein [Planctomycetota bacterium]|nr:DUF6288 domain-containing protein [Planctomycetota bacterium]
MRDSRFALLTTALLLSVFCAARVPAGEEAGPAKPAGAKLWVKLDVAERAGVERFAEPVTGGVPLPEGLLEDPAKLALLGPDGKPVPAQFTVANRWYPGKSAKWVLVDFQASLAAGGKGAYWLTDAAANPAPPAPVAVELKDGVATVTTGALKLVVKRSGFNLFDEAWVDETGAGKYDEANRIVKPHTAGPWAFSSWASLPAYKAYSPANDPEVTLDVEEAGPMRAVLRLSGRNLSKDDKPGDERLLDFVCRIHCFAGSPLVRVVYTLSCRQGKSIAEGVPLDRAWLSMPLVLDAKTRTWAAGLPGGKWLGPGAPEADKLAPPWRKDIEPPGPDVAKFHQPGLEDCWIVSKASDRIEYHGEFFRKREPLVGRGKLDKAGCQTAGWLDLSDETKGMAAGVKWFWQTWPRAVKADPSAVLVMLHANFESAPPLVSGPRGPRANWYPGMSQTSTSMFYFHGKRDVPRIVGAYAGLNRPLRPIAPPSWYCEETQAFGRVASSAKALYDEETAKLVADYDARLKATLDHILKFRDVNFGDTDHYGMFNFGDVMDFVKSQRSDPGDKHTSWDNGYYDFPHAYLLQFARTGDLDFLEAGVEAEQHVGDLDMLCWHPDDKMTGSNRYCDGTMHIRWAEGGIYASETFNHFKTASHFERFYLTGDRRSRETGLLSAGFAMKVNGMGWGEPRSLGHGPLGVLSAWEATGEPRYLARVKQFEHQIAAEAAKGARINKGRFWQGGISLEGIREYYEHTGDERALETLKLLTEDCFQKKDSAESTLHAFAFLGAQLDRADYTELARKRVAKAGEGIVKRPWGYGQSFGNELRNTPYVFWYLTKDLPKKLEPKKFDPGEAAPEAAPPAKPEAPAKEPAEGKNDAKE